MAELSVWLKQIPSGWMAEVDEFRDTPASGMIKVGAPPLRRTGLYTANVDCYAIRVFKHLEELFNTTAKACGSTPTLTVRVRGDTPRRSDIRPLDLLCYVLKSRTDSLISQYATWEDKHGAPQAAKDARDKLADFVLGGTTFPLFRTDPAGGREQHTFLGICAEAWCDHRGNNPPNARAAANIIMHELMHNKSRWQDDMYGGKKGNPDSDWPHSLGGGGLAAEKSDPDMAKLTDVSAKLMCKRLPLQNKQYVERL